jgi:hypothetical protein
MGHSGREDGQNGNPLAKEVGLGAQRSPGLDELLTI